MKNQSLLKTFPLAAVHPLVGCGPVLGTMFLYGQTKEAGIGFMIALGIMCIAVVLNTIDETEKRNTMKKAIFLLSIVLSSCSTCMIGQIPSQYLYVDSTCGAALPDYLTKINVTDNCQVVSVEQTPSPGSWLTVPTTTVLIRATDNFNNRTDMMFTLTLIDTIPTITVTDTTLITKAYDVADSLYDIAEKIIAQQLWHGDGAAPDSLWTDDDFCNSTLLTWTDPCKGVHGRGLSDTHVYFRPTRCSFSQK